MGFGVSIFLIAVGAVLAFAVNVSTSGIDLNTIGVILMVAGAIGLAVTALVLNGGGWYGPRRRVVTDAYVDDEPAVVARRPVVRDAYVEEARPVVSRRRVVRRHDVF